MTSIFITGVAGFIGSNYAHYVAAKYPDYHIAGVDKLSDFSRRENVAALESGGRLKFHKADICDREAMEKIYREHQPEYVVNFAAESHNDRAIADPTTFVRSNVLGAQTLLDLSRILKIRRHVHISTIEVYGEQASDVPFFTEASPLNAKTPYSASKAAGDSIVRSYMQTYPGMDICMTHCANNYGPYQFPEKLIPLSITNMLTGKKAALYGDGLHRRDWLHVYDHCAGIDAVLHSARVQITEEAATNPALLPIFDFSARHEVSNREILGIVVDELGLKFEDHVEYVADRPNHDRRYLINPLKAETDLGFKPSISFEQGLRETVRWYVDNRSWWEPILAGNQSLQFDWSKK